MKWYFFLILAIICLVLIGGIIMLNNQKIETSILSGKKLIDMKEMQLTFPENSLSIETQNDMTSISPTTYTANWFPDNSPLAGYKNLTFEVQIEDGQLNKYISLKGNTLVPRYYSGSFTFNSSLKDLVKFTNLNPNVSWSYSTNYNIIKSDVINYTYDENGNVIKEDYLGTTESKVYKDYANIKSLQLESFKTSNFRAEAYLDPDISACGNLNTANSTYTMNQSVNTTATCFQVLANNITLNCMGYTINYSSSGTVAGYGINSSGYNYTTIKNCDITEGTTTTSSKHAIYIFKSTNNTILNNSMNTRGSTSYGIILSSSNNTNIINNTISASGIAGYGIAITGGFYMNIKGNNVLASNNAPAVYLESLFDFNVINNTLSNGATTNSNGYAIYLVNATRGYISGNLLNTSQVNSIQFYGKDVSYFNHTIDSSNLIEGYPVNYTFGADNLVFENINNTYGQVIIVNGNNVTIKDSNFSYDGINLYYITNSTIQNNNISSNTGYGITLNYYSDEANIYTNDIRVSQRNSWVVYSSKSSSLNISNNYFYKSVNGGGDIYLTSSNNSNVYNNTAFILNDNTNFYLVSSYWNNVFNNIFFGRTNSGSDTLDLSGSSNNNITNNLITHNATSSTGGSYGILLESGSDSNLIKDNRIMGMNRTSSHGVYITISNNNTLDNNSVYVLSPGYGVYFAVNSRNNIISNSYITILGDSNAGIGIGSGNHNFTIINVTINTTSTVYDNDLYVGTSTKGGMWNFTNVTRSDGTSINISWATNGNGTLNMHWYLDVNVTDGTNPLADANVTAWDNNSNWEFSTLSLATGFIPKQTLLEYTNINNTQIIYYSNYTVNTTLAGYTNDSQSVNMSGNKQVNVILTSIGGVDTEYPVFSTYLENPANSSDYLLGTNYAFSVDIANTNGSAGLEFNKINYTLTNLSDIFNTAIGDLGAGTYQYYYWAYGNGTSHNYNISGLRYYTVNKVNGLIRAYVNNTEYNFNSTNGLNISLNGTLITGSGEIYLMLNGSEINRGTSPLSNLTNLSYGYYNFTAFYDGNQNYTADSEYWWINITQFVDSIPPYFTTIPNGEQITYGSHWNGIQFNANDETGFGTYKVNDTRFAINSSGFLNDTRILNGGIYYLNISINDTSNNGNYTIYNLNATKANSIVYAYINNTRANYNKNNNSATNIPLNGTLITGTGNINMYLNGSLINGGTSPLYNGSNLNIGVYYLNVTYDGNDNYSSSEEKWKITITQYTPPSTGGGNVTVCKYKKMGYYNIKLPWFRQENCV